MESIKFYFWFVTIAIVVSATIALSVVDNWRRAKRLGLAILLVSLAMVLV